MHHSPNQERQQKPPSRPIRWLKPLLIPQSWKNWKSQVPSHSHGFLILTRRTSRPTRSSSTSPSVNISRSLRMSLMLVSRTSKTRIGMALSLRIVPIASPVHGADALSMTQMTRRSMSTMMKRRMTAVYTGASTLCRLHRHHRPSDPHPSKACLLP